MTRQSAREKAQAQRDTHEGTARQWVADKTRSQLDLAELLERSGELILDDPSAMDDLSLKIGQTRARLEMADRVIEQAGRRYADAAREALLAEADELDTPIRERRAEIRVYEERTAELLAPLMAHTGREWRMVTTRDAPYAEELRQNGRVEISVLNDAPLRQSLQELEDRQRALLTAAEAAQTLDLTDVMLAKASVRLREVTGEMAPASRVNVSAAAAVLRRDADGSGDADARAQLLSEATALEAGLANASGAQAVPA